MFLFVFITVIDFSDSVAGAAVTDDVVVRGCDVAADERAGVVPVSPRRRSRHHTGVRGLRLLRLHTARC